MQRENGLEMSGINNSWRDYYHEFYNNHELTGLPDPGNPSRELQVFEPSNANHLNAAIGAFRQMVGGRVFFRGERQLHGEYPQAGFYRNGNSRLNFESIGKDALELCGKGDWLRECDGCLDAASCQRVVDKLAIRGGQNRSLINNGSSPNGLRGVPRYAMEGVWQQYVGNTRWLDVVDSIWVALWMATRQYVDDNDLGSNAYGFPQRKVAEIGEVVDRDLGVGYVYVYLLGVANDRVVAPGLTVFDGGACLDLRQAVPGFFLRPHAQHAALIDVEDFRKSSVVVSLLRISSLNALRMLGNSALLSVDSVFPPEDVDSGFRLLLSRVRHGIEFDDRMANVEDRPYIYVKYRQG